MTRVERVGQGVRVFGIGASGQETELFAVPNCDGTEVPYLAGTHVRDTVALRRIDGNTLERIDKKAGEVVGVLSVVFSDDGRTRTMTANGVNAQGKFVHNVVLWEKQ